MASVRVTFTLDIDTVNRIETTSKRLSMPKSQVIREAVQEYHDRMDKLSERERLERLRAFDELITRIPLRPAQEADRELREIRRARRSGGRRTPADRP